MRRGARSAMSLADTLASPPSMSKLIAVQALRGLAALSVAALHAQGEPGARRRGRARLRPRLALAVGGGGRRVLRDLRPRHGLLHRAPCSRPPAPRPAPGPPHRPDRAAVLGGDAALHRRRTCRAGSRQRPGLSPSSLARLAPLHSRTAPGRPLSIRSSRSAGRSTTRWRSMPCSPSPLASPRRVAVPALIAGARRACGDRPGRRPCRSRSASGAPDHPRIRVRLAIGSPAPRGSPLPGPARATLAAARAALFVLPAPIRKASARPAVPSSGGAGRPHRRRRSPSAQRRRRAEPAGAPAVALGDASYALYLVHPFAIRGLAASSSGSAWRRCSAAGDSSPSPSRRHRRRDGGAHRLRAARCCAAARPARGPDRRRVRASAPRSGRRAWRGRWRAGRGRRWSPSGVSPRSSALSVKPVSSRSMVKRW